MPQVAEHRLDDGDAPSVELATPFAVDCPLHALGVLQGRVLVLLEERHLPDLGALRVAQTLLSQVTGYAVALRTLELVVAATVCRARAAARVEFLSGWTEARVGGRVVGEVAGFEPGVGRLARSGLVVERIG